MSRLTRASNVRRARRRVTRPCVSAIRPSRYNAFHLVFADAREAAVVICDGESLEVRALAPGEPHLITEGSYGVCIVCSKEIPPERLEAIPETVRCIEHQREHDAARG